MYKRLKMKKYLGLIFATIITASSCTKKGDTGATGSQGPAGPSFTGAISGHVSLYDMYGSKVLTGLTNVQLTLSGSSTKSPDNNGYYIYGPVTTGSYNLLASCSGYGSAKINNFQFLSDTLNRDIKLSQIPEYAPTSITVYPAVSVTGDSVVVTFNADSRARSCILFMNSNTTVNNEVENYLIAFTKNIVANASRVVFIVPTQDHHNAGLVTGAGVYYAAYGYAYNDASAYLDLTTGKLVYNSVSSSYLTANSTVQ